MTRPLPLLALLAALAFAGAAFLAPFDGQVGADLPLPQVDPPIQPVGWAFAIWGPIYAWLIASGAYGLWRRADDPEWDRVRGPLIVSLGFGIPWLWIAVASTLWAVIVIALMAATAILAFLRAPVRDRMLLRGPVGLYAGWLTAATAVALGILLAGQGLLLSSLGWAFVLILVALGVAVAVQWRRTGAWTYGAAVAWALLGIAVKDASPYPGLALLAAAGISVILWVALGRRRPVAPTT